MRTQNLVSVLAAGLGIVSSGCVDGEAASITGVVEQAITGTFDDVVVNGATVGSRLAVRGNGDHVHLENTTAPTPASFDITNNGDLIWDVGPVPKVNTDNQTIRMFRRTATSGAVNLDLTIGGSPAVGARLSGKGSSYFLGPSSGGKVLGVGHGLPEATLDVRDTNNTTTADVTVGRFDATSHFDTTAGPLSATALRAQALNDRPAGTNSWTNYALWVDAANATKNYAIYVARGDVSFGAHYISKGPQPTISNCGTDPFVSGNDTTGFFIPGTASTECTVTFAQPWPGQVTSPDCILFSQNALRFTTSISATQFTITNIDDISGGYFRYQCLGREDPVNP